MALNTFVGSFAAKTTSGTQAITVVGFQPAAIIFFAGGGTVSDTFVTTVNMSVGFGVSTTTTANGCAAIAYSGSTIGRRVSQHALTFSSTAGANAGLADVQSFDAGGFTLNWTTPATSAWIVNYLALGGSDLTGASVISWQATTADTTNRPLTGAGFKPDCVLHVQCGGLTTPFLETTNQTGATLGFGGSDAAGNMFAVSHFNATGSTAGHYGMLTSVVSMGVSSAGAFNSEWAHVSFDTDGFTLNPLIAPGNTQPMISLCLKGPQFRVGTFNKVTGTAPAPQSVGTVGFQPAALLFAGVQNVASTAVQVGEREAFGAVDAAGNVGAAAMTMKSGNPATSEAVASTTGAYVKANNDTGTVNAKATLTSMDTGGFTLSWGTNDAVATQVGYVAIGAAANLGPFPPYPPHVNAVYRM